MYNTIATRIEQGICIVTMQRPERLNAWTYEMGAELVAAFDDANQDEAVQAIVLTGAGRGFCAGADVEAVFKSQADNNVLPDRDGAARETGRWVRLMRESKPVVAAINGAAIGVGLTQILPMDFLVASDAAKLSVRFVKMGLVPELASSQFLMARLGFGKASELMLTGRTVSAAEALELGLVDKVVAADQLLQEACDVARAMGANPQGALRQIKALITENANETDFDQVQRRELKALDEAFKSPEHKEAIAAFMEKRTPDFAAARRGKNG
ncbi:MAG: enoyl-CoA hydratase/isomerase family protein [Pseudomonadales bacterium]